MSERVEDVPQIKDGGLRTEESPRMDPKGSERPCGSEVSDRSMECPPQITEDRLRLGEESSERPESPHLSEASYKSRDPPPQITQGACSTEARTVDRAPPAGCHYKQSDTAPEEETIQVDAKCKSRMKEKYMCLLEGQAEASILTLLPDIDTEMYITNHKEHGLTNTPVPEEMPVGYNDILRPLCGEENLIRSVLTVGISGVGKTVSVQKFILDWAQGKVNQDIHFIIPLPFRELNLIMEKTCSLLDLLQNFHKIEIQPYKISQYKIMFIFDGLDECQYPLDFQNNPYCSDVTEPASVDVLLTNLIKGNLLPSALLWITSRPETASRIPPSCIDRETEVRGFSDSNKEKYIQMKINEQCLANKILTFLRTSPSLFSMCQIPVYCWILVIVLERLLRDQESGDVPKTLTQIYTHFLLIQTNINKEKCSTLKHTVENIIFRLSKLAFQQLEKGNLMFYEDDLKASDLSPMEVSLYPGVCSERLREELGLRRETVFHFGHLSIQEHLAALYVFLSFANREEGTCFSPMANSKLASLFRASSVYELLKNAVDLSLHSEDGQLDFFLRFLIGFSLESNQMLLQGLLVHEGSTSNINRKTVQYIQKKICENPFPEKCMNLFYCLSELHDLCSLEEEVRGRLSSVSESRHILTPSQCSSVAFLLLNSGENLEEFDMGRYTDSEECTLRLLPVVKASTSALLRDCNITSRGCKALASLLKLDSCLKELDLSNNNLQDSGFSKLIPGLKHPLCNLHTLKLWYCGLTEQSCDLLAETLRHKSSLKALNLSRNDLQDSGLKRLSAGLQSPNCQLQKLKLNYCGVSAVGCEALEPALSSGTCSLRELSLSDNTLLDEGLHHLCTGLGSAHSRLEKLELRKCGLTHSGCVVLATALGSCSSRLRELNLSENMIQDAGVKLLSGVAHAPDRTLEKLELRYCGMTASSCEPLSSLLPSLTELDVGGNNLRDTGVTTLSSALSDPNCKLKKLGLSHCGVSDAGGSALGWALGGAAGRLQVGLMGNCLQTPELKLQLRSLHCLL